jgi:hypothetical protein
METDVAHFGGHMALCVVFVARYARNGDKLCKECEHAVRVKCFDDTTFCCGELIHRFLINRPLQDTQRSILGV